MDEILAKIEAEYCPPLDPALLAAILSDFDLTDDGDVQNARSTLDALKESADLEEAAGFDASATGGVSPEIDDKGQAESHPTTSTSRSKETDVSSVSNGFSSVELEDHIAGPSASRSGAEELEKLDNDEKVQLLLEIFGDQFSRYSIEHTLNKCGGKCSAAMDELLNHVYFGESSSGENGELISAKGVDGFFEGNIISRGRKGKSKSKRLHNAEERRASSLPRIVPQYSRIQGTELLSNEPTNPAKSFSAASSRSPSSSGISAAPRRDAYDLARTVALFQADAARRKAKSDQLWSGAAAYYSQVGREYSALARDASVQVADQLAASQSTPSTLDLHGIDVRNAVRIAQTRVEEWWDGLGESRFNGRIGAEERQSGYSIIVGLGRHSDGGSSKLGPAVSKMLRQNGWRFEPAGGVLIVKSRVKS